MICIRRIVVLETDDKPKVKVNLVQVLLDASEARRGAVTRAAALGVRTEGVEVSDGGLLMANSELLLRSGVFAAGLAVRTTESD